MQAGRPGFSLALGIAMAAGFALLAGAATGVPAVETARPPFSPAPRNCFSLQGFSLRIPRLTDAVHVADDGSATIAWITPGGVVMSASQDRSGVWGTLEAVAGVSPVDSRAPVLAGDAAGDLALAWVRGDAVQVALRPAGGGWGRPRTPSRAGQGVAGFTAIPLVSVAAGGRVAIAWPSIGRSQ